jgi:RNA polymerase sigma factor (sigma-70 family)
MSDHPGELLDLNDPSGLPSQIRTLTELGRYRKLLDERVLLPVKRWLKVPTDRFEDGTQETYARIVNLIGNGQVIPPDPSSGPLGLTNYIRKMLKNVLIEAIRKERTHRYWVMRYVEEKSFMRGYDASGLPSIHAAPPISGDYVEEHPEEDPTPDLLTQAISHLPPRQREVVQYVREGLTHAEIGLKLGIKKNSVTTCFRDAMPKLRELLEADVLTPEDEARRPRKLTRREQQLLEGLEAWKPKRGG